MRARALRLAALVGLGLLAGGCLPEAATSQGRATNGLWAWFIALSILVGAVVWTLVTLAIVRRRREPGLPRQIHGDIRIEIIWTTIPIVIVIGLFAGTLGTLNVIDARSPEAGVDVIVTAFRWQWRFDYPRESISVVGTPEQPPELVVPVDQPVHIALTAPAGDVDHAFFVPQFLFKRDAIPGRTSTFDFTVEEPGTYRGQCAEFCGTYHAQMLFSVRAVSAADYQAWLASQQAAGSALPIGTPPPVGPGGSTVPSNLPSVAPPSGGQP
ncbi:MAG TPA: cytochrome c oxidase subunit II [Candidatus Limnocylindrales bacterium]|nr:cytochrome c oxidase subunit II [Candidatus Limnocylindrales bacterium]